MHEVTDPTAIRTALAMVGEKLDAITATEAHAVDRGMAPSVFRRLNPAVTGAAAEAARAELEQLRDRIVPLLADGPDRDAIAGNPAAEGYRVAVHLARRDAASEGARRALMHFEIALSDLAAGRTRLAATCLHSAAQALGTN